ncbi:2-amino-4-hydroxy-6-hydroxymethyldihydropteridine diphosphokinase [Acrocarpospora macrocephala]|uniref:2-amino-4-hydroxy-6-hydroxymethyldihydropteridine diphosphokinase n=1 Tax=Acrocarpospora macrocephala TaxID=150177 RepID=A0A5M3XFJ8_9ACTN|nr:2-amino-4-hydroxy-6-hydroxymethyldihydropteridine diphosphokinase [Acrocarpospora macrocephala]GES16838.1 2-amino-4-hydroxy-6-hydroxymethyldihydropteridine diphosphokinase [Acrocarpospora macrocephala]
MKVVLALGSNLGRRMENLQGAVDALFDAPGLAFVAVSPVYETEPVGGPAQGAFLNAVVIAEGMPEPRSILERALSIEDAFGRERSERWGPRTLDVDLIMVGDLTCEGPELILPHPRAHERAFVLVPWAQADRAATLPGRGPVAALLADLDQSGVRLRADLALQPPA